MTDTNVLRVAETRWEPFDPDDPAHGEVAWLVPKVAGLFRGNGHHSDGVFDFDLTAYLIEGEFELTLDGERHASLGRGDVVFIAGGTHHEWKIDGPFVEFFQIGAKSPIQGSAR